MVGSIHTKPLKLYYDNQAATHAASNYFHERTKCGEIGCHFFIDKMQSKDHCMSASKFTELL